MQDVNHAVANLRTATGLSSLEFNHNGHVELVFDGATSIDLVRIDERHIELSAGLSRLSHDLDTAKLSALLRLNHGHPRIGAARLALDPRDRSVVLCERVDVRPIDGRALERILLDFLARVEFWKSDAGSAALAALKPQPEAEPGSDADDDDGDDGDARPILIQG